MDSSQTLMLVFYVNRRHISAGHNSQRLFSSQDRRSGDYPAHGQVPARCHRGNEFQIAMA